jgi:hypothetical protein
MKFRVLTLLAVLALAASPAGAALVTFGTFTGHYGAEVAAEAFGAVGSASGSLTLSGIPGTATIEAAYLYTNSWFSFPSIGGTFGALALGPAGPTDTAGGVAGYRFDVTSEVTGNGSYAFDLSGGSQIYGVALAVVYEDAGLPLRSVIINDVADANNNGVTMSTAFTSVGGGGGRLWLFTQADDGLTGELIKLNGGVIGGPIDANLGSYASLFNIPVAVLPGVNTVELTTAGDYYGWHLAVLETAPTNVPEPLTLLLTGAGLSAVALRRRRARR